MEKTVNVLGATGLVGRELVSLLLREPSVKKIRLFSRRSLGIEHPAIEEHLVNFASADTWQNLVTGDAAFSALGTTLRQAGSKKAQYEADYTTQYRFAAAASNNNVPVYVLVSSAGANATSRIFYSRIKGQLDEAIEKLSFSKSVVLRPSLLVGRREKPRLAESMASPFMKALTRFIFKKYRPVEARTVAKAMINASLGSVNAGHLIYELDEIFSLADQNRNINF